MTKVKMCGLYRDEDIQAANLVHPDYVGFVFYKKSHRNVDIDTALRLKGKLDTSIKAVGVFVNEDISFIKELIDKKIIDMLQLHGNEDESYILKLRNIIDNPDVQIIKAAIIKSEDDFSKYPDLIKKSISESSSVPDCVNNYSADYYLLDSGMGSGSSFNWDLITDTNKPIFLAGGLDCENISEALKKVKPYAVDVSSGIETDKVKDLEKMRSFMNLVKTAEN